MPISSHYSQRMTCKLPSVSDLPALTYPRPNLTDNTLEDNDLAQHCPLDNGRHRLDPKYNLGNLALLPPEILTAVLTQVDLQSLTEFRRVNQRVMEFIDSIPQYQAIVTHAPASLRGILSIGTGEWISCQGLYDKLRIAECETCGDFGGYLYIITCRRVCFMCLSEEPAWLPLLRRDAIRKFGLHSKLPANLPQIRSIPGCYSPNLKYCPLPLTLIDYESARDAGIILHGSLRAMEQYASRMVFKSREKYDTRYSEWTLRKSGPKPRPPRFEDSWDGKSGNPIRFMAIVAAPYLNPTTRCPEWGFHCVGCRKENAGRLLNWRRKFIMDTFNEHIRQCGDVTDGSHRLAVT